MGVKAQFLYFPHKRAYNLDKDTEIWLERPLQTHLELNAVYDVMYLLDLHRLTKVIYHGLKDDVLPETLSSLKIVLPETKSSLTLDPLKQMVIITP